jgi:4a-hydroxytetrahydrobiopterin dehydratase
MADKLSEDAVTEGLQGSLWEREGDAIVRDWTFADFKEAMAWVNRVAEVAEEANHHPDIQVHGWNKVRLTLSTHSVGGLTQGDLDMARRIDKTTT